MDDYKIKTQIRNAYFQAKAPPGLLNRTIERSKAITMGRAAENSLQEKSFKKDEYSKLMAQALIGKLMQRSSPPDGITNERMVSSLVKNERFLNEIKQPLETVLQNLENGNLIKAFGKKAQNPLSPTPEKLSQPSKETALSL